MLKTGGTKKYWEENIGNWGDFYFASEHSGEKFNRPHWFEALYRATIMPVEARLMKKRYQLTLEFINEHIKPGMIAVDVGCGTGLFVVEMLKRGAKVKAVDFAQSALDLSKTLVEKVCPEFAENVEYLLLDVSKDKMPDSDAVLAMGITPYVENLADFFENILPTTKIIYCLIIDPNHWANRIRRLFKILNVRSLHWYHKNYVDKLYNKHHWELIHRQDFASGYLDFASRK